MGTDATVAPINARGPVNRYVTTQERSIERRGEQIRSRDSTDGASDVDRRRVKEE